MTAKPIETSTMILPRMRFRLRTLMLAVALAALALAYTAVRWSYPPAPDPFDAAEMISGTRPRPPGWPRTGRRWRRGPFRRQPDSPVPPAAEIGAGESDSRDSADRKDLDAVVGRIQDDAVIRLMKEVNQAKPAPGPTSPPANLP